MAVNRRLGLFGFLLLLGVAQPGQTQRLGSDVERLVFAGRWDEAERRLTAGGASLDTPIACTASGLDRATFFYLRELYYRADADRGLKVPQALVAACRAGGDKALLGQALLLEARARNDRAGPNGDFGPSDALLREALPLNEANSNPLIRAETLFYLGIVQQFGRKWEPALERFRGALALAEQAKDPLLQALAHRHIGYVVGQQGDKAGYLAGQQRSLELRKQVGPGIYLPIGHGGIAFVLEEQGDKAGALQALLEAVKTGQAGRNRRALYGAQASLARLLKESEPAESARWAREALATAEAFGDAVMIEAARKLVS